MKTFVIAGHCSNDKKIEITRIFIEKLKDYFDCKILYVDHLPCHKSIAEIVDYSLHISYNPIQNVDIITDVTKQFRVPFWNVYMFHHNIVKTVPNHSYAHHNSLFHAFRFLYQQNIDKIHFLNYDCNEDTFESIIKNEQLLNEGYEAVFFPYRYDPNNGVCTEFFSLHKSALDKMFLKLDNYNNYEDLNIIRKTDYNVEYVYYSHLKHRNIKYYLHDMWPTRDGEIGTSNFEDINENEDIVIKYNDPRNKIISVVPIVDYMNSFQTKVFFMRFGGQIGDKITVKFYNEDYGVCGESDYFTDTNGFFYLDPKPTTKYVSTEYKNLKMTFDLTDIRNYGEIE